jgi:hypothetical protein
MARVKIVLLRSYAERSRDLFRGATCRHPSLSRCIHQCVFLTYVVVMWGFPGRQAGVATTIAMVDHESRLQTAHDGTDARRC